MFEDFVELGGGAGSTCKHGEILETFLIDTLIPEW